MRTFFAIFASGLLFSFACSLDLTVIDHWLPDAGGEDARPAISVSALTPLWSTEKFIRWGWTCTGQAVDFGRFELVVGTSAQDVQTRSGSAVVHGPALNPELGLMSMPDGQPIVATSSGPHLHSTTYFAQLQAIDSRGRISKSNVATATTTAVLLSRLPIFREDAPAGWAEPRAPAFQRTLTNPYQGQWAYEYNSTCPSGNSGSPCWMNLQWGQLGLSLGDMNRDQFEGSLMEFAVSYSGTQASYWSEVHLFVGLDAQHSHYYSVLTFPSDGQYHLYQIPLRVMGEFPYQEGLLLQFADLGNSLQGVIIGGGWTHGGVVRVDEISIRW
ncbi:MAG: hypothetical protein HY901_30515 [Deltaproteobacteria bacterium]|nr:hypothetical protein [Deltaproteobacteria bacterium]